MRHQERLEEHLVFEVLDQAISDVDRLEDRAVPLATPAVFGVLIRLSVAVEERQRSVRDSTSLLNTGFPHIDLSLDLQRLRLDAGLLRFQHVH